LVARPELDVVGRLRRGGVIPRFAEVEAERLAWAGGRGGVTVSLREGSLRHARLFARTYHARGMFLGILTRMRRVALVALLLGCARGSFGPDGGPDAAADGSGDAG